MTSSRLKPSSRTTSSIGRPRTVYDGKAPLPASSAFAREREDAALFPSELESYNVSICSLSVQAMGSMMTLVARLATTFPRSCSRVLGFGSKEITFPP